MNKLDLVLLIIFLWLYGILTGIVIGINYNKKTCEAVVEKDAVIIKKNIEPVQESVNNIETLIESYIPEQSKLVSLGTYTITAYCPCEKCCGKSNGITASGTTATAERTIAADTSVLPFGTKLLINGHEYIVEDRGGGVKGKKIDIFFNSHDEALKFGRQNLEVFLIE